MYGIFYFKTFLGDSLLNLPLIVFDHISMHYIFGLLVRSGVYCFLCFISVCVNSFKFTHFEQTFRVIIKRNRSAKFRSYSFRCQINQKLEQFISEHTMICYHILRGNENIWNKILLSFLCTNLPSNIYFFIRLFLMNGGRLPLIDSLAIGCVFFGQTCIVVIVLVLLAQQSKALHRFHRYVPAIQQLISGRAKVALKLQYDDLLQRLTRGARYGVTIGPFWVITYETIFQVMLQ